jgi:hypothetical protein
VQAETPMHSRTRIHFVSANPSAKKGSGVGARLACALDHSARGIASVLLGLLALSSLLDSTALAAAESAPLPWPWQETSIGTASDPGAALFDGTYVLANLGADIWSPADKLKFVAQPLSGDGALVIRINSVASDDGWSRCGLMMRESLEANARNVLLSLTSGNGLVFQSRRLVDGSTSLLTAAVAKTPPVWLKVERVGPTFIASYSADGASWTVQGRETIDLPEKIQVGVAYANRSPSVWAMGVGEQLKLTTPADTDGNGLPDAWERDYFGHTGVDPDADADNDGLSNAQEWERGTHPNFTTPAEQRPALAIMSGNLQSAAVATLLSEPLVVRVVDAASGAPLPGLLVSFRLSNGQGSFGVAGGWAPTATARSDASGRAQTYLKLSAAGGPVTVAATVGNLPDGAVTFTASALLGDPASAVQLTPAALGTVTLPGQSLYSDGTYTLSGATGDINGGADSGYFAWQPWDGDGVIVTRVAGITAGAAGAKAGLMIRESLGPVSQNMMVALTPASGVVFQRKLASGLYSSTTRAALKAPQWLALRRSGATVAGYVSADGLSWSLLGSCAFVAERPAYVGLAFSTQTPTAGQATFDCLRSTPLAPPPWSSVDLGGFGAGNIDQFNADTWLIRAGGDDFGGTADAGRFIHKTLPADGRLIVRVAAQTATHSNAKSGLMIRETTGASSRYVLLAQTPGAGTVLQTRTATGGASTAVATIPGSVAPGWLKLERLGASVTAFTSPDGQTWSPLGQVNWGFGPALLGLATASRNSSTPTATAYEPPVFTTFEGQQGWSAAYFPSADLSGAPALLRRDAAIDFNWPAGTPPVPGLTGANYSVRWQGKVLPTTSDTYTFSAHTTGGVRLRVNGLTVIDRWNLPPAPTTAQTYSGQVSLNAGEPTRVELEYVNGTAEARIQLSWSNASQSDALVPTTAVQPTDADNDGLPDDWEAAQGLDPLNPADASLTPDGDNLPVIVKYQLGLPLGQAAGRVAGGVIAESWTNLPGVSVADLTNSPRFPGAPTSRALLTSLETISNRADNYGQRLRGYLVAPQDGVYQFWIAGDDRAELWLSPTESPFDRKQIARVSGTTAVRGYDAQAVQKSAPITLQAGHAYYLEVLHKEGTGQDHLSVAWKRPGAPREVIAGTYLATFPPLADDLSGDGLPEAWRSANGIDVSVATGIHGAYGDRDGDKASNLLEYQTGTRADLADTDGDGATDLGDLTLGTDPLAPDAMAGVPTPWLVGAIDGRSLVTGGQHNGEIALWTDATPFTGNRDAGGILYQNVVGDFTLSGTAGLDHTAQADLEVGLMVRGSLATNAPFIALTRSRQSGWMLRYREFASGRVLLVQLTSALPPQLAQLSLKRVGSMVSLYAQTSSGACRKLADYPLNLDNAVALAGIVGWGPSAGAFTVRDAQLRQAATFAMGPAQPDAAPAGLSAFDSAKWIGEWDGLMAPDSIGAFHRPALTEITALGGRLSPVLVQSGTAAVAQVGPWETRGGALVGQDRRGELTWQVNLTEASVYLLELSVREGYAGKFEPSHFPLKLWVDGHYVNTQVPSATASQPVSALWFTPWLPAGVHTIRVLWDGAQDYTQLQVETLGLYKIEDEDSDANGVADWIDRRLQLFNGVDADSATLRSAVSPLPLEGRARWPELARLTAAGVPVPVFAGAGYRWFADVPLSRGAATPIGFYGENEGVRTELSAVWSPHDALAGGALHLKAGSRLLIGVEAGPGETAGLWRAGVAVPLVAGEAELDFPTPGTFHLVGRVTGPQGIREADTVVTVYAPPSLPSKLPGLLTRERIMTRPPLAAGVMLEADPRLNLTAVLGSTTQMAWEADDNVNRRMVARIGTNGPILAATDAPGTALYATLDTYTRQVKTYPDGTTENETLVIMSPVHPDHAIRIEIFVAGVVFSDGTRVKTLRPADLDPLGQARVLILRPPNATTSICHRTMLTYQGAVIGTD